jgi:metal-dependent amidase/aminoacylase/carboxypeptidase family protein
LLAGCQIVQALQSIVAREVDPIDNAVVSVTRFHCGQAFNVIAEAAEIGGTVRSRPCAILFLFCVVNISILLDNHAV